MSFGSETVEMETPLVRRSDPFRHIRTPPRQAFASRTSTFTTDDAGATNSSTVVRPVTQSQENPGPGIRSTDRPSNRWERTGSLNEQQVTIAGPAFTEISPQEPGGSWLGDLRVLVLSLLVGLIASFLSFWFVSLPWILHEKVSHCSFFNNQLEPWTSGILVFFGSVLSRFTGGHQTTTELLYGPQAVPFETDVAPPLLTSTFWLVASAAILSTLPLLGGELGMIALAHGVSKLLTLYFSSYVPSERYRDWFWIALAAIWCTASPFPLLGPLLLLELQTLAGSKAVDFQTHGVLRQRFRFFVLLVTLASLVASFLAPWLFQYGALYSTATSFTTESSVPFVNLLPNWHDQKSVSRTDSIFANNTTSSWGMHIMAACIGLVCGCWSALVLAIVTVVHHLVRTRPAETDSARQFTMERFVTAGLALVFSAAFQGLLISLCPWLKFSGMEWLSWLASGDPNNFPQGIGQALRALLALGGSVVLSVGLGHVPGGGLWPLMLMGGWMGRTASLWLETNNVEGFDHSLAVLCGMVAGPMALLPIPLTATLTAAVWGSGKGSACVTPVLLAALTACMVSEGSGWKSRLLHWSSPCLVTSSDPTLTEPLVPPQVLLNGLSVASESAADDDHLVDEAAMNLQSEEEILRGIRSTIFGVNRG